MPRALTVIVMARLKVTNALLSHQLFIRSPVLLSVFFPFFILHTHRVPSLFYTAGNFTWRRRLLFFKGSPQACQCGKTIVTIVLMKI